MQSVTNPLPAFSDLLRSWRRSRKLSQTGLAEAAEISQRHLSFLESGRSAPSREMVLRLSRALDLPLREQNSLLHAAGFAAIYTHHNLDAAALGQARQALDVMLRHHEPWPAIVVDRNWNLLLSNEANTRFFSTLTDSSTLWEDIGGAAPNVLRAILHPGGLRPRIRNWQVFAAWSRRQLSDEVSANPFNREARELLDEINAYPDMPAADQEPPTSPLLLLEIGKDDVELKLFTLITTFGTPLDVTLQELRIETFFPADEVTDQFFARSRG